MSLTEAQRRERLEGITATDMAALTGKHPFKSPINVWEEKTGRAPFFDGNLKTKWGSLLEVPIRADYAERFDCHLEVPGTLSHPEHAWRKATPDGLVYVGSDPTPARGLEIKCHTIHERWRYGAPGTDEVPIYELVQCAWNMHVARLPRWDLVLFADNVPTDYGIDFDAELDAGLVELGERFWIDHVQADVPPEPDGSDAYGEYVARLHKTHGTDLVDADIVTVTRLRALRQIYADAMAAYDTCVQEVKLQIGGSAGLKWTEDGRQAAITWKQSKAGRQTAWKTAAEWYQKTSQLLASGASPQLRALHRVLSSWEVCSKVFGHNKGDGEVEVGPTVTALAQVLSTIDLMASPDAFAPYVTEKAAARPFCVPKDWPSISKD